MDIFKLFITNLLVLISNIMQLIALSALYITTGYGQTPAVCTPVPGSFGENCNLPCWTCLTPYFGNTFNFQGNGMTPSNGFCGGNSVLNNDQYLAFKPLCNNLSFTITSASGCRIQAAIYTFTPGNQSANCNQIPIVCNPDFNGTINNFGSSVNFTVGNWYVLAIDGVDGAQCNFTINAKPSWCIEEPQLPLIQQWGPMTSNAPTEIPCPDLAPDVTYDLNVPAVAGATQYRWFIKRGNATLIKPSPYNPPLSGSDITVIGSGGTSIKMIINNTTSILDTIEICAIAKAGCNITNELCKEFIVKKSIDLLVKGNNIAINNGNSQPSLNDGTDYGNVNIDSTLTHSFTVINNGIVSINISDIKITGNDKSDFFTSGISLPITLHPLDSVTFNISFMSSLNGNKKAKANISIVTNDCPDFQFDFALKGTSGCVAPKLTGQVTHDFLDEHLGSVVLNVSEGSEPYQYKWSTGDTTQNIYGLSNGTYIVKVTERGGCVTTDSFIVESSSGCSIPTPTGIGENCMNPCWTSLTPYFGNTFNFQGNGMTPSNGFCGGNSVLNNDQYLAFKPLCNNLSFTITSASGCRIQAAIYTFTPGNQSANCNQIPIVCNPDLNGTINNFGSSVNFTVGNWYMLMIDGVGGAQCYFTIDATPSDCITKPSNPFSQNWGPMTSNAPTLITCHDQVPDQTYDLNVPAAPGATHYRWFVKRGNATLLKPLPYNPPLSDTDIIVNGIAGTSVKVNFHNTTTNDTVEICAIAKNGCDSTNALCKTFIITNHSKIIVLGNGIDINSGNTQPSVNDGTDFGRLLLSNNKNHAFTVKNLDSVGININDIIITGLDSLDFSVQGISLPILVAGNDSVEFYVSFIPTTIGNKNAKVRILTSSCISPSYVYQIAGIGMCNYFTNCPTDTVVVADTNQCNRIVNYVVKLKEFQDPAIFYSMEGATTANGKGTGSGSIFNTGLTKLIVRSANSCDTGFCSFNIIVKDIEPPAIICPSNITVSLDSQCNFQLGKYKLSEKRDNCTTSTSILEIQSPDSNSVISLNNTTQTVTITAIDESGNTSNCSFIVEAMDKTVPSIICPPNYTVCEHQQDNQIGYPLFSDNCGIDTITNNVPIQFVIGKTNVVWTVRDLSGNENSCQQIITKKQTPQICITINGHELCDKQDFIDLDSTTYTKKLCNNDYITWDSIKQNQLPVDNVKVYFESLASNISFVGNSLTSTQTVIRIDSNLGQWCLKLIDPKVGGQLHCVLKPFVDENNNNQLDPYECTGNVIVVTIQIDAQLSYTLDSVSNPLCIGTASGAISITPSGGTPEYSHSWNNGEVTEDLHNIRAGAYTDSIRDVNGCLLILPQVTLYDPPLLRVDTILKVSSGMCATTITAQASGGSGLLSYNWGSLGLGQTKTVSVGILTMYTVTVTDANGCTATKSISLQPVPKPAMLAVLNPAGQKCSDVPFSITLSADSLVTFFWEWTGPGMTGSGAFAATTGTTNGISTATTISGSFNNQTRIQRTAVLRIRAQTGNGCPSDTATLLVPINPEPRLQPIYPGNLSVCNGAAMTTLIPKLDSTAVFSSVSRLWFRDNLANIPTAVPASGSNNAGGILNLSNGVVANQTTNFRFYPKVSVTGCTGDTLLVPVMVVWAPQVTVVKPLGKVQSKPSCALIDSIEVNTTPNTPAAQISWSISHSGSSLGGTCFSDITLPINGSIQNYSSTPASARWIFRAKLGGCFGRQDTAYVNVVTAIPGAEPTSNFWFNEMIDFSGRKSGAVAELRLQTANILEVDDYVVEKSDNGLVFTTLTMIPPHMAEILKKGFILYDSTPSQGINFYRVRTGMSHSTSRIVALDFGEQFTSLELWPNPAGVALNVAICVNRPQAVSLTILDARMQVVRQQHFELFEGRHIETFDIIPLPHGLYYLRLDKFGDERPITLPFVKGMW